MQLSSSKAESTTASWGVLSQHRIPREGKVAGAKERKQNRKQDPGIDDNAVDRNQREVHQRPSGFLRDIARGNAHCRGALRNVRDHHRVRANPGAGTDGDRADDLSRLRPRKLSVAQYGRTDSALRRWLPGVSSLMFLPRETELLITTPSL